MGEPTSISKDDPAPTRAQETQQRIIAAASQVFLELGYRNCSIEDVAAAAGVTKPTVYSHFGSKEGLLTSVTQARVSKNAAMMSSALSASGDTRTDLTAFGKVFLERAQGAESVRWHRLCASEAVSHPEIGAAIFASGPAKVIKALTDFLAAETSEGRLACPNPGLAAEQFLGLLLGVGPIRALTGQPAPSPQKRRRIVDAAVDTFLAAFSAE
ncbi:MAG: TetR/AcrR family transcriptional regulator [Planctomycetota bacterium]